MQKSLELKEKYNSFLLDKNLKEISTSKFFGIFDKIENDTVYLSLSYNCYTIDKFNITDEELINTIKEDFGDVNFKLQFLIKGKIANGETYNIIDTNLKFKIFYNIIKVPEDLKYGAEDNTITNFDFEKEIKRINEISSNEKEICYIRFLNDLNNLVIQDKNKKPSGISKMMDIVEKINFKKMKTLKNAYDDYVKNPTDPNFYYIESMCGISIGNIENNCMIILMLLWGNDKDIIETIKIELPNINFKIAVASKVDLKNFEQSLNDFTNKKFIILPKEYSYCNDIINNIDLEKEIKKINEI